MIEIVKRNSGFRDENEPMIVAIIEGGFKKIDGSLNTTDIAPAGGY